MRRIAKLCVRKNLIEFGAGHADYVESCWRARESPRKSGRLAALSLFNQPQRHRHDVLRVRDLRGVDRRNPFRRDSDGIAAARPADFHQHAYLQRVRDRPWPDHDLFHADAGDDGRIWQLDGAADDRRTGHGVSAHEQHFVLAAASVVCAAHHFDVRRRRARLKRRRHRLDALRAAVDLWSPGARRRFRDPFDASRGCVFDPRLDQFHHHHLQYAGARHDPA